MLQILAALVIAIGSGLIGRYVRNRNKEIKTFDYRVISDVPLILSKTKPERLKLTVGDLEVKAPRVTEIRFANTGNKTIDEEDFLGEPYVIQRPDAHLLEFNVAASSSEHLLNTPELVINLGAKAKQRGDEEIWLRPRTLNKQDWFIVQIFYDGGTSSNPPTVTGRVKDQSRSTAIYPTKSDLQATRVYLPSGLMFGATLAFLGAWSISAAHARGNSLIVPIIIAVAAAVLIIWSLVAWYRGRQKLFERLGHKNKN